MHYILAITVDHYHPSSSSSWSSLEVQCSGSKRCKAKLFLLPRLLSQPLITITMTFEIDSPLSPFRAPLLFFFFFLTLLSFPFLFPRFPCSPFPCSASSLSFLVLHYFRFFFSNSFSVFFPIKSKVIEKLKLEKRLSLICELYWEQAWLRIFRIISLL